MKKLSLEALESKGESVVSLELLNSISGGTENACHDDKKPAGPNGSGGPEVVVEDGDI